MWQWIKDHLLPWGGAGIRIFNFGRKRKGKK